MNAKTALSFAGTLVVGLLGGIAIANNDKPAERPSFGPTKTVAGVPVGYEQSKTGAINAALGYEGALAGLTKMSSEARAAALKELASKSNENEILDAAQKALSFYDQEFGQTGVLRTSVVGFRVAAYEEDSADVDLWEVSIVGRPDGPAKSAWATRRLSLRWEGDWKLAKPPVDTAGPTPTPDGAPTDAASLINSARDLSQVRYVPQS